MKTKKRGQKFSRENGVQINLKSPDGSLLIRTSKRAKVASYLAQSTEKQGIKWTDGIDLLVRYQYDVTNSGTFYNKTSLLESLRTWLEPSLIEYCCERGMW